MHRGSLLAIRRPDSFPAGWQRTSVGLPHRLSAGASVVLRFHHPGFIAGEPGRSRRAAAVGYQGVTGGRCVPRVLRSAVRGLSGYGYTGSGLCHAGQQPAGHPRLCLVHAQAGRVIPLAVAEEEHYERHPGRTEGRYAHAGKRADVQPDALLAERPDRRFTGRSGIVPMGHLHTDTHAGAGRGRWCRGSGTFHRRYAHRRERRQGFLYADTPAGHPDSRVGSGHRAGGLLLSRRGGRNIQRGNSDAGRVAGSGPHLLVDARTACAESVLAQLLSGDGPSLVVRAVFVAADIVHGGGCVGGIARGAFVGVVELSAVGLSVAGGAVGHHRLSADEAWRWPTAGAGQRGA